MFKIFKASFLSILFISLIFSINIKAEGVNEGSIKIQGKGVYLGNNYFIINKNPGDKVTVTVNLQNTSKEFPATSTLFAADAITGTGGGMGIINPDNAKYEGVGGWINLKPMEVTLKAGESKDIPIEFQIPQDVTPGDHLGTIVLYKFVAGDKPEESTNEEQKSIIVNRAYSESIAVLVKIPGPVEHNLIIKSVEPSWTGTNLFLDVAIRNDGNVYEKSNGTIELYRNGRLIGKNDAIMNSIYPGTEGIYTFAPPDELKEAGNYEALVKWDYADKHIENRLNFKIESRDVKQAAIMQEEAKQGREISMNALVLTPKQLAIYGIAGLGIISLGIGTFIIIKKKKAKIRNSIES